MSKKNPHSFKKESFESSSCIRSTHVLTRLHESSKRIDRRRAWGRSRSIFSSLFLSLFFQEIQFRVFFIFNSWIWELDFDACYLVLLVSVVYRASRPCKFIFMTIIFGDHPKLLFSLSYSSRRSILTFAFVSCFFCLL